MKRIAQQVNEEGKEFGLEVVDVRIKRADLPEQNSEERVRSHARRAPARSGRVPRRGRRCRQPYRGHRRPRGHRSSRRRPPARASAPAARAMRSAIASSPRRSTAIRTSSASTVRCRPTSRASGRVTRACCWRRTASSSSYFTNPLGNSNARRSTEAMNDLVVAIGLVMVIEGLLWAAAPQLGLKLLAAAAHMPEHSLRAAGAAAVAAGVRDRVADAWLKQSRLTTAALSFLESSLHLRALRRLGHERAPAFEDASRAAAGGALRADGWAGVRAWARRRCC